MDKKPEQRKSLNFYYLILIAGILILQFIFFSNTREGKPEEISYSKFLELVDEGKVKTVVEDGGAYQVIAKEGTKDVHYKVGGWKDEALTERLRSEGVEFRKEIPNETMNVLLYLFSIFGPIILFIAMGSYFMKRMAEGAGGGLPFGKAKAKVYMKNDQPVTFDDVAGQDEAKESLMEIVDYLHNPKKYSKIGAVLPKGVLLVGPPGTGKTLLGKAVAGEADVPFFTISGSEFVEMFAGLGATKVRDLFKEAKEKSPCIVFIDEIDAVGKKRHGDVYGGNDEREQTLNQLLNEMDGFDGNSGIVVLAATNRPEILDPALTRPGRFDRQIPVELPDILGREAILKVHAKKIKLDPNCDLKQIARMTAGASGAQLANIINEGALRAVREGRDLVTEQDLEESVEVVIAGQKKKNYVISPKEKEVIAYHEVGHALVAATQKGTAPVTKITIIPRTGGALGYTMQVDEEEKVIMTKEHLLQEITTLTGGRAAEELVFGIKTTGASNDIEKATRIARSMVTRFGMEDEFGFVQLETQVNPYLGDDVQNLASVGTQEKIDQKVKEIIDEAQKRALNILKDQEDTLHRIADRLLEKETLTGEEFMELFEGSKEEKKELPAAEDEEETEIQRG